MKVKDILYLHEDLVKTAARLGAVHPEDVVQDMWMKLLAVEADRGNIDKIKYKESGVNRVYLSIMLKNAILDEKRKDMKFVGDYDLDYADVGPEEDGRLSDAVEIVEQLPIEDRMLLMMYFDADFTEQELALKLSVTQPTINKRLKKVTKKIKKSYDLRNNIA